MSPARAVQRTRYPRRRREQEEGEEEGKLAPLEDDSLSEPSLMSGDDEDFSDASEDETEPVEAAPTQSMPDAPAPATAPVVEGVKSGPIFGQGESAETAAMRSGQRLYDDKAEVPEVDFDELADSSRQPQQEETVVDRRRREHDDYRKKRDSDPAFVPNRGAFFMHDHRHDGTGANGFRPFTRGRGRGRGAIGGHFSSAGHAASTTEPADQPWRHDMHETVTEATAPAVQVTRVTTMSKTGPQPVVQSTNPSGDRLLPVAPKASTPNRSLSHTAILGNVVIRVLLAGMEEPITFPQIPFRQYTRLPTHRPPLRRDKPVRVRIPEQPEPRYVFPDMDRSFIFIPRAMRPNQQNSARGRARQTSFGGYGSIQASIFGGSTYTPSIAMSRRSSRVMSPTGSVASRMTDNKPVVKLPPQPVPQYGQFVPMTGYSAVPPPMGYPPYDPSYRKINNRSIPMHQPRPQKTVSVADIESPQAMFPSGTEPFFNQIPINGEHSDPSLLGHARTFSHPSQISGGTPLSQIPESAIHAAPFQPQVYGQGQVFVPTQPMVAAPGGYYYAVSSPQPPPYSVTVPTASTPIYVVNPPNGYMLPANGPGNTVAQEQNGMVYYYDQTQMYSAPAYPQMQYVVPQEQTYYYASHAPSSGMFYPQG